MNKRGPDYAYELTGAERRTLDLLQAKVRPRRRLTAPVLVGVATALVLFVVAGMRLLIPTPAPTATMGSVAGEVLNGLAAAAGQGRDTTGDVLYRHTLDISIVRTGGACNVSAMASQVWVSGPPVQPQPGRISASFVEPPPGATAGLRCETVHSHPPGDVVTENVADIGRNLRAPKAAGTDNPWDVLVQILTSPETSAAERAAALRARAADPGPVEITPVTADAAGHRVKTLAVPTGTGTAYLTFDPATGALLQRTTTNAKDGTELTTIIVYLHMSRAVSVP